MKVIFIPDYREGNPYQQALADSLAKEGVQIRFCSAFNLLSILNYKPDIVHIHWLHPFILAGSRVKTIRKSSSFIGKLLIVKLLGIKIVWTVHNLITHGSNLDSFELSLRKLIAKLSDEIIVHCYSAKRAVTEVYGLSGSSISVIPHGNFINSYENMINKKQAKQQLQLNTEDLVFLYFGKIRPYKGIIELIDAFKKMNNQKVKLLITGSPYRADFSDEIKNLAKNQENIKLVFNFIPDKEIQIYLNAADVVVLPYRDILTSGAVVLAISFGKPVIAPAIGCIADVLDSKGSFLYNPSKKDGLFKAIQRASMSKAADLQKMGNHNFELAKQLKWDEIALRTYDVYKR